MHQLVCIKLSVGSQCLVFFNCLMQSDREKANSISKLQASGFKNLINVVLFSSWNVSAGKPSTSGPVQRARFGGDLSHRTCGLFSELLNLKSWVSLLVQSKVRAGLTSFDMARDVLCQVAQLQEKLLLLTEPLHGPTKEGQAFSQVAEPRFSGV